MGPAVTTAPERHLIKKYANRKLYDTRTSRYITLEGIAELVRDGHEIKVVDRDNGHDLTQVTLSQVVLSQEKRGPARLVDAGGEVIAERGQALLDYVRKTLNVRSDLRSQMERRREDFEEQRGRGDRGARCDVCAYQATPTETVSRRDSTGSRHS